MGTILLIMIFLPSVAALVVMALGSQRVELVRWVSLGAAVATLLLAIYVWLNFKPRAEGVSQDPIYVQMPYVDSLGNAPTWLRFGEHTALRFEIGIDGISIGLVGLTALLLVSSILVSWDSIKERPADFYALLLLLGTGMLGVFCAFDLILFYVFFEFTLIPLFFLIGIWGGPQKRYAARKFFIYTLAGSLISLVGLVSLAILTPSGPDQSPTFSIPLLAKILATQPLDPSIQNYLFLAMFVGFAIKVPLVPFHTWLPLAHVEAPTAGSVLLAGVLLKLGTYGFLRLAVTLLPAASMTFMPLIAVLSVIGILYGAFCALAQDDVKKLVAYSSVSHLGFCMLGMFALNVEGICGAVLQMINHGLSTGMLFLLVGMVYERYHTRQLSEIGGLAQRIPWLTAFMVFACLSSMGLPGLNGFVGEILSLIGMFKVHPLYAVLGAIGIILGAWYLMTMLQRAFFGPLKEPEHGETHVADAQPRELAALIPLTLVCVWLGLYPKPLLDAIRPDVEAIVKLYRSPSSQAGR